MTKPVESNGPTPDKSTQRSVTEVDSMWLEFAKEELSPSASLKSGVDAAKYLVATSILILGLTATLWTSMNRGAPTTPPIALWASTVLGIACICCALAYLFLSAPAVNPFNLDEVQSWHSSVTGRWWFLMISAIALIFELVALPVVLQTSHASADVRYSIQYASAETPPGISVVSLKADCEACSITQKRIRLLTGDSCSGGELIYAAILEADNTGKMNFEGERVTIPSKSRLTLCENERIIAQLP